MIVHPFTQKLLQICFVPQSEVDNPFKYDFVLV